MFALITHLLGAGCDRRCAFDDVVGEYISGETLLDCGDLPSWVGGPPIEAWFAARDCAVAAMTAQSPFIVRWEEQGIEGSASRGYVGVWRDSTWALTSFHEGYGVDGRTHPTVWRTCTSLAVRSSCTSAQWDLCLDCLEKSEIERCGE